MFLFKQFYITREGSGSGKNFWIRRKRSESDRIQICNPDNRYGMARPDDEHAYKGEQRRVVELVLLRLGIFFRLQLLLPSGHRLNLNKVGYR